MSPAELRDLMKQHGRTQHDLARLLPLRTPESTRAIRYWLTGDRKISPLVAAHPLSGFGCQNKLGLYDMHGNVWQWTDSLYEDEAAVRVLRGGAGPAAASTASRHTATGAKPSSRDLHLGFRLSRVPSALGK